MLVPLLVATGRYERVADQAANICEEVLYICTGEFEKHKGKELARVLFVYRSWSRLGMMAELQAASLGLPNFVFASAGLEPGDTDLTDRRVPRLQGYRRDPLGPAIARADPEPRALPGGHPAGRRDARGGAAPPGQGDQDALAHAGVRPTWVRATRWPAAANERLFRFLDENIRAFVEAMAGDKALD